MTASRLVMRALSAALAASLAACGASEPPPYPPASAIVPVAPAPEPAFVARADGPLAAVTPLQVVSLFSYEPGETLTTPATEIAGFVTDARVAHGFGALPLQTLAVDPVPAIVKADKLLVVAWGPRAQFSVERAREMGRVVMREAMKSGVDAVGYAPIARDQGVTTLAPDVVATAFVEGARAELHEQQRAAPARLFHLKTVVYEAGAPYLDAVSRAVAAAAQTTPSGAGGR